MKRFTSAFHYMFPTKKYKRIDNSEGRKVVIFEENGREMNITDLSSGEKQIVFRGGFLLKDKESSKGRVILIDEPEISLHPSWQLKIVNYFKKLFTDHEENQTSQLFITTHSPFIVHNATRSADKIIVLKKDENGTISVSEEPKFYSWSSEAIVKDAFNISHSFANNAHVVYVEGETDEKYFEKCLEIFNHQDKNLVFRWIGRTNEKGQAEYTGDSALNQAKMHFQANMHSVQNHTTLLYDSDTRKPEEDFGFLKIRRMKANPENSIYCRGVENLLTLPSDFDYKHFYSEIVKKDEYGARSTIAKLDKVKLCTHLCENTPPNIQLTIFEKLNAEILRIVS